MSMETDEVRIAHELCFLHTVCHSDLPVLRFVLCIFRQLTEPGFGIVGLMLGDVFGVILKVLGHFLAGQAKCGSTGLEHSGTF